MHGAEHPAGQSIAGELFQHGAVRRVDRHAGAAGQHARRRAVDLAALH